MAVGGEEPVRRGRRAALTEGVHECVSCTENNRGHGALIKLYKYGTIYLLTL